MAAASVFVFHRRDGARSTANLWIPAIFTATAVILLGATLVQSPRESLLGLGIIVIGVPFYRHWRNSRRCA
jgi:hypothetical protein